MEPEGVDDHVELLIQSPGQELRLRTWKLRVDEASTTKPEMGQEFTTRQLKLQTSRPLPRFERLPIFDQDMSWMREGVWRKCGRAAAHKHPEAQVVPDSDRSLHGDEVAQVKHVGASVVDPVVWDKTESLARAVGGECFRSSQTHPS